VAASPPAATGTPFGPRLHAVATYLKTYQALSYERLQATLADLFGLPVSQGGLMNILRRAQGCFQVGREQAVAALRCAPVVASDEAGVRIEGSTLTTGCSTRRRRSCITPPRRGLPRSCAG
jgi:transposase